MIDINYLGIIPARLGSRRLKRKNIKKLRGKELIYYTINSAQQSNRLDKTIFSTDSEEIRQLATKYNAYCPFLRPKNLADHTTTNLHVILHAVEWLKSEFGFNIHNIVLLQPTSPFRTSQDIDHAINIFESNNYPTLASVCGPYSKRHPTLMKVCNEEMVKYCNNENTPYYVYNASIYIAKLSHLYTKMSLFSEKQSFYVMSEYKIDIDTEEDFYAADLISPMFFES